MRVVCIEPYFGGSHKAFIEGWQKNSRHEIEVLTLPANKWKWRMRHGAIYFSQQIKELLQNGKKFDVIFCSDMLNLAELSGLTGKLLSDVPKVIYFHENQLTYPQQFESERDYQYVMTNFTSALCADKVIFNSKFHREEFLTGLERFFRRMPDNQPLEQIQQIWEKSEIVYPGIDIIGDPVEKKGCLKILWAARWEHDKNPEDFFAAMKALKEKGLNFELNVIGEKFREMPQVFDWAKDYFENEIVYWGYQKTKDEYYRCLRQSDVIVSTAIHEFYGIGVMEAVSAGCYPILPERLSYPELLNGDQRFLYKGTVESLVSKLEPLIDDPQLIREFKVKGIADRFGWPGQAGKLDEAIEQVCIDKL